MNEHHRTLLDDLDEVPVGAAPVGHLLSRGRAVKRRRQRAFVAGAAAVTALVVGGSALALQGTAGSSDDRDSEDPVIADSAARSRVAHVFVDFARGETDELPVDTPVALYLGNFYQRTIPDAMAEQRGQWEVCDKYAQRACPMSALEVLAGSQGEVVIGDSVTSACLATLAKPLTPTVRRHHIVLSPPEPRRCSDDYAVQIWINDDGQITAVNLLLGSDS